MLSRVGATACTAVGDWDNGSGARALAERWNGTAWAVMTTVIPAGATASDLRGVSCVSATSCEAMATSRTCPHPADTRVHLSGTAVRDLLGRGQLPPPEFSRPEVARLLADGYRARRG